MSAKIVLQRAALDLLCRGRAGAWLGGEPHGTGAIFAGHRVLPDPPLGGFAPNRALSIAPDYLERLLWHLRDLGIAVVSLGEALRRLRRPSRADRFACFTFDDGYVDNLEVAMPIFARFDAPFTVFVTTGFVDRTIMPWWHVLESIVAGADRLEMSCGGELHRHWVRSTSEKDAAYRRAARWLIGAAPEARHTTISRLAAHYGAPSASPMLSWEMVREMVRSGLVEIGCHTVSHPMLSTLPAADAAREIEESRAGVEAAVGRPARFFAYPYGDRRSVGAREGRLAGAAGFKAALTTRKGTVSARAPCDRYDLPRVPLNGHFQRLEYVDLFLSGLPFALGGRARRPAGRREGRPAAAAFDADHPRPAR